MSATTTPADSLDPGADGRDQPVRDAPPAPPVRADAQPDLDAEAGVEALLEEGRRQLERRDYEAAHASLAGALATRERELGVDHPALVPILNPLASVHIARGDFAQAALVLRRVLTITEAHFGPDHDGIAGCLSALAHAHLRAGQLADAEPPLLRLRDVVLRRAASPLEMAAVLESLAALRHAQGEYVAAEQLWRQVLEIRERALPADDPAVATSLERLADTCAARGRAAEARTLLERALAMRAHALGAEHPALGRLRAKLASVDTAAARPASYTRPVMRDVGALPAPADREPADSMPAGRPRTSETSVEVLRALVRAREEERESAQAGRTTARAGASGEPQRHKRGPMVFAAVVAIAAVLIGALVAGGAVQRGATPSRPTAASRTAPPAAAPVAKGSVGGDVATGAPRTTTGRAQPK